MKAEKEVAEKKAVRAKQRREMLEAKQAARVELYNTVANFDFKKLAIVQAATGFSVLEKPGKRCGHSLGSLLHAAVISKPKSGTPNCCIIK